MRPFLPSKMCPFRDVCNLIKWLLKLEELKVQLPDAKDLNEINLIAQKILESESVKKLYGATGDCQ